jgi:hypothetical protein
MEHINDIYRCSSWPNKRKGEFGNVARIATPIVNNYLRVEHVNCDKLIMPLLHRNMRTCSVDFIVDTNGWGVTCG